MLLFLQKAKDATARLPEAWGRHHLPGFRSRPVTAPTGVQDAENTVPLGREPEALSVTDTPR